MAQDKQKRPGILSELRRRHVFRIAGIYIAGAWVVIEVASVLFDELGLPDGTLLYLFAGAAALFPVALVFAWIFDVTPTGIVRTRAATDDKATDVSLRKSDYLKLGVISLFAIVVFVRIGYVILEAQPAIDSGPSVLPDSVAVLPLEHPGADPDTEVFAAGITDDIRHSLSQTQKLAVIATASSSVFEGHDTSVSDIAELLRVEYVLHGSVRRDADTVRVIAQLTDRNGRQVWSESYDRVLEQIFAIQAEIAASVASQIVREVVPTAPRETTNDAYIEYQLGRNHSKTREAGWQQEAEAAFRRAIALDPSYAPAYAGLAYSLAVMRGDPRGLAAAEKALELDNNLAEAHAIYGLIRMGFGGDENSLASAETSLRKALSLDPSLSDAYNWLAIVLARTGREQEAMRERQRGYDIDPLNPPLARNFATDMARAGDFEQAEQMLLRLTRIPAPLPATYMMLWHIYMEQGQFANALTQANKLPAMADRMRDQSIGNRYYRQMLSYAALGMAAEARDLFELLSAEQSASLWLLLPMFHPETSVGAMASHLLGENKVAWQEFKSAVQSTGQEIEDLDDNLTAVAVTLSVLAGETDFAAKVFEERAHGSTGWYMQVQPGRAMQALLSTAYAYRVTGDDAMADALLAPFDEIDYLSGMTESPDALGLRALWRALANDSDGAYEALGKAVNLGWADYYAAINDIRWGDLFEEPRFAALLEEVRENVAEQRASVERRNADSQTD